MAADRWRTGDSTDDPGTSGERTPWAVGADRSRGPDPRIGDDQAPRADSVDLPRTNPDGTWEWKGHRLEASDNAIADRGLDRRREVEPAITRDMRTIEASLSHGSLDGCPEHTLKSADRFKEKLARQVERNPDVPSSEVEMKIHDGIRYTFTIDDAHFTAGVTQVHRAPTTWRKMMDPTDRSTNSGPGVRYYSIAIYGRTRDNPSGLARRRQTEVAEIDEHLCRDLTWEPTSAIVEWENGELGEELYEISEAEAQALIERFRARWQT